ncbi:MAG: AmmeMemoRadiSam system protein B [Candidatus Diapherotrites archaeon CG10_big_fil_rev_8_21_14_0_10_31_34]|nr:MAG: AmmeMemoRadiSam system protein B [Candidatus Diapherotrites archaeon CG10_big_fil_rev_8_21_14_0_10_31_34]PJA16971.1 MAG: AmmeMemoRadiSam system protein B [Candidatus Diapherotrites archaeon CG_4_10_14_0_2_um_filter_31_5]
MLREAVIKGSFYPKNKQEIITQLKTFFSKVKKTSKKTNYFISPHAGTIYSGQTASYSYSLMQKPETVVILSPNHTGYGEKISVYPEGTWVTPLRETEIDKKAVEKITELNSKAKKDEIAHLQEHSIEIQLIFLQYLFKEFKIVPITLMTENSEELEKLAETLIETEKILGKKFSVIASSDFTHFLSSKKAKENDFKAIKLIKKMNVKGFHELVKNERLSICGHSAIEVLMQYCKKKGIKKAELIDYSNSGKTTGDNSSVVAYASIGFFE